MILVFICMVAIAAVLAYAEADKPRDFLDITVAVGFLVLTPALYLAVAVAISVWTGNTALARAWPVAIVALPVAASLGFRLLSALLRLPRRIVDNLTYTSNNR